MEAWRTSLIRACLIVGRSILRPTTPEDRRYGGGQRKSGPCPCHGCRRARRHVLRQRPRWRGDRCLAAEAVSGIRDPERGGRPELVRAAHPRLRGRRRRLPQSVSLGRAHRQRCAGFPDDDPGAGRRSAGRDHGCFRVPSRGRSCPLDGLLRSRRRRQGVGAAFCSHPDRTSSGV